MDLTNIRKRPGMYIGYIEDGSGLQNMVREVVSFAIRDVVRAGSGRIDVFLNSDGSCVVRDDGWGLSTLTAEEVLTNLHARTTFDLEEAWSGHQSGGMCIVNALSEWLSIRIRQDGHEHSMEFRKGVPQAPLALVGTTRKRETEFRFRPDPEIFGDVAIELKTTTAWLRSIDLPSTPITFALSAGEGAEDYRATLSCVDGSFI